MSAMVDEKYDIAEDLASRFTHTFKKSVNTRSNYDNAVEVILSHV